MIPRPDSGVIEADDPIPYCSRTDPDGCKDGQTCDLLIRFDSETQKWGYYTGCVAKGTNERAEGDPCDPEPTNFPVYTAEGVTDQVRRDPCAENLVCVLNTAVRGAGICAKACTSGVDGDIPQACTGADELCTPGSDIAEYCRKADNCDVTKQTGCTAGEGCYLLPNDDASRWLTVCNTVADAPIADGEGCSSFLSCNPGSLCAGPVHTPAMSWDATSIKCRPLCGAGVVRQATDDDAGVPNGEGCPGTTKCEQFGESNWAPGLAFGQCGL